MSTAPMTTDTPLLKLENVCRHYESGETIVRALDGASLEVHAGEFIAIMGQSGSGKSTLMNILGCLDRPTDGHYLVDGIDVSDLDADELASLRRDTFGFVFQRYNLLGSISAAENVELPAIYAGRSLGERREKSHQLLGQLGLGDRGNHRPGQLSGGQQQRVSIARALVNNAKVVLADEPTGALDSRSGEEVLALLKQLHSEGRTIILITHDANVAAHAQRVVQIKDGRIISDSGRVAPPLQSPTRINTAQHPSWVSSFVEAVKMAMRSLRANIFRSALTLLGVVIGVASVVTMMAIGNGSKAEVMQRIQSMGTNLLLVQPGAPGSRPTGDVATLTTSDADAIREVSNVTAVSPERRSRQTLRIGNLDYRTNVTGVWPDYVKMQDWQVADGSFVNAQDVKNYSAVIVLGKTVANNLFPNGESPVGKFVLVSSMPFEVVGVLAPKGANAFGSDMDDTALIPLSTGAMQVFGTQYLNSINVKIASADLSDNTQDAITRLLTSRHGVVDFQVRSTSSLMETAASTQNTLTILLGSVAAISLLVGGIGVMNIMLVNVTERTREIGVRMATGARMNNILLQFNTEALVVCGIGGLIGVALGFIAGWVAMSFGTKVEFTTAPALFAFSSAVLTGLIFGYLPARKAAHMDPVVALSSE